MMMEIQEPLWQWVNTVGNFFACYQVFQCPFAAANESLGHPLAWCTTQFLTLKNINAFNNIARIFPYITFQLFYLLQVLLQWFCRVIATVGDNTIREVSAEDSIDGRVLANYYSDVASSQFDLFH